jgi:hypothetical protein
MMRKLVTIDNEKGQSILLSESQLKDPLLDPGRPGFKRFQVWLTEQTPAPLKILESEELQKQILSAPTNGSVFHIYYLPPDEKWISKIQEQDIKSYFSSIQAESFSLFDKGKHPYYQKSNSLEFCLILKGEVTLILDDDVVQLKQGDSVVQKGSNHAWSNHTQHECILAISSHNALSQNNSLINS